MHFGCPNEAALVRLDAVYYWASSQIAVDTRRSSFDSIWDSN